MLIRSNPKLSVLWSLSPSHSCELFEELKFEEPNPDIDNATAIRSDDLGSNSNESQKESKNLNSVVRRQFQSLPILTTNDIERAMRSDEFETVADFIQADADVLRTSASISQQQADELFEFFRYDFRITN
jgi:ERCC4-type nuclease